MPENKSTKPIPSKPPSPTRSSAGTTVKYEITVRGENRTYSVKAETVEQAAIKGAAKHFFGFKPVAVKEVRRITGSSWGCEVANKAGEIKTVYVGVETGEQAEANEWAM